METHIVPAQPDRTGSALEVLAIFLKLGLTSFGGPMAHVGYFHREFVARRRWLDDGTFADLLGLCQFLPGPASSQLGFSIGLLRAGWRGGVAAWCGFTLPSAALLLAFAVVAPRLGSVAGEGLIHGLKLVAVAVVAQAVWDMARRMCADRSRAAIALVAIALTGVLSTAFTQMIVIGVGAALGLAMCRTNSAADIVRPPHHASGFPVSRTAGVFALILFFVLLLGLPALAGLRGEPGVAIFQAFYRTGALVFGGGHVVLPLLQQQTVATGWVSSNDFLAGYGAAQAVPGPLFTFATFLGWRMTQTPHHATGALLATAGIFLPGLLLVLAALPFWQSLRARPSMAAMLAGVNASVVGLLACALYSPVWTGSVFNGLDFAIAAIGFVLLTRWKMPPLGVVVLCALGGIAQAVLV